ncbi:MAG: HEPN domain-containing protein [Thermofilum sp.]|nr:HEPN domain-containing protein [Thermofilum sp.]
MAVGRIEDAGARLYAAESHLKESDYPGAMLKAQMCMELSIKALLDELGISYKTKEGRYHTMSAIKSPKLLRS